MVKMQTSPSHVGGSGTWQQFTLLWEFVWTMPLWTSNEQNSQGSGSLLSDQGGWTVQGSGVASCLCCKHKTPVGHLIILMELEFCRRRRYRNRM